MLVWIISISIVMVVLFVVSRKSRVKIEDKWDTTVDWTPLSITTACVSIVLGIILLVITLDYAFISLPLIAVYIFLLFLPEIGGMETLCAGIFGIMSTFMLLMLFAG